MTATLETPVNVDLNRLDTECRDADLALVRAKFERTVQSLAKKSWYFRSDPDRDNPESAARRRCHQTIDGLLAAGWTPGKLIELLQHTNTTKLYEMHRRLTGLTPDQVIELARNNVFLESYVEAAKLGATVRFLTAMRGAFSTRWQADVMWKKLTVENGLSEWDAYLWLTIAGPRHWDFNRINSVVREWSHLPGGMVWMAAGYTRAEAEQLIANGAGVADIAVLAALRGYEISVDPQPC